MSVVFVMLVVLGIPAIVILTPQWLRSQERHRILDAMAQAAERGTSLPAEQLTMLLGATPPARPKPPDHVRDQRRGTLLLAATVGFALIGTAVGVVVRAGGAIQWAVPIFVAIAAVGAIPGMIGLAYLMLARNGRRRASALPDVD